MSDACAGRDHEAEERDRAATASGLRLGKVYGSLDRLELLSGLGQRFLKSVPRRFVGRCFQPRQQSVAFGGKRLPGDRVAPGAPLGTPSIGPCSRAVDSGGLPHRDLLPVEASDELARRHGHTDT